MITQSDLVQLADAAKAAGFVVDPSSIKILHWPAGAATHRPTKLPPSTSAVYVFKLGSAYLKVGRADIGSNANFNQLFSDHGAKAWICVNTERFNILALNQLGAKFLNFAEAFFILKLNPLFEGR